MPADVVLRLWILKHIRNWSYEVLERELRANLVYRDFTCVGGGNPSPSSGWIEDSHLQGVVHARQDALPYTEPPYWYYPIRQSLAAALLQAGRYAEAQRQFQRALSRAPSNGWSYYGLAELHKSGGNTAAARKAEVRRHQLLAHPLCNCCLERGTVTPAEICDHVEPHRGDVNKFWLGPFMSLRRSDRDQPPRQCGGRKKMPLP
jgi:tetratricopeptide (TPR) repeat protein